jgi:hypothetical protein
MSYRVHYRTYMAGLTMLRQTTFEHPLDQAYRLMRELREIHAQYGHTADVWMVPA